MFVAAIQHDIVWEDRDANLERLAPKVAAAAGAGAQLVVLTEMFSTGFSMNVRRVAENVMGPTAVWMGEQAVKHDVWLCGTIPTWNEKGDRPVNRLHLISPGGALHTYDKIHTFSYAGETDHYTRGAQSITVDVGGIRVTPYICYDLRFANRFWDRAEDTDCFVVPANWPAARRDHWQALLKARAIENQAYVIGVNRIGDAPTEGGDQMLQHAGDSMVIDPTGQVLASAAHEEAMLLTSLDPARVAKVRESFPFMKDRRG